MTSPRISPTASGLPSLATPDDVVARLGRNLNQIEAARVDAMLQDGSAIIRRYARNSFSFAIGDVISVVADTGNIVLPGRPIISVDGVMWKPGLSYIQNMPITWYVFDGVDTITIPGPRHSGVINLPYMWYQTSWYSESFEVTYTHGEQIVPSEVNGLLASAIVSELSTPTQSATIQSESIGAYSYSMRRSYGRGGASTAGAVAGIHAALSDFGMESVLADYRQSQGTLAVRH